MTKPVWTGTRDSSLRKAMAVIESIPTPTCGMEQVELLYELSLNSDSRGVVVEIGSLAGRSTIALALGQIIGSGQPVYSVDHVRHPDFLENLERAGVLSQITPILGLSSQVAKRWRKPIALLFIDANHSYWGTRSDLRSWTPHVIEGGIVVLHDYGSPAYPGVHRAAHSELLSKPMVWQTVSDLGVGSLYVVRRRVSSFEQQRMKNPFLRLRRHLDIRQSMKWLLQEVKCRLFGRPIQWSGPDPFEEA